MSTPPIGQDPFFDKILRDYFSHSSVYQELLRERFYAMKGITENEITTPELQREFREMVLRYNARGFSSDTLADTYELPLSSEYNFYRNYLSAFYGNYHEVERQDLWTAFLKSQGYHELPPDSESLRAAFRQFLNGLRDREVSFEATTGLAPAEITARFFLSEIIQGLRNMLSASEELVRVQATALMFHGLYQQEYTKMMTRVPSLTGGDPGTIDVGGATTVADLDLNRFTFGYYDISLQEVLRWALGQILEPQNDGRVISFGRSIDTTGLYDFKRDEAADVKFNELVSDWLVPQMLYYQKEKETIHFGDETTGSFTVDQTIRTDGSRSIQIGLSWKDGSGEIHTKTSSFVSTDDTQLSTLMVNEFMSLASQISGYPVQLLSGVLVFLHVPKITCQLRLTDPNPPALQSFTSSFIALGSNGLRAGFDELEGKTAAVMRSVLADAEAHYQEMSPPLSLLADRLQGQTAIEGRWLTSGLSEDDATSKDLEERTEQNAVLQQYVENIRSLRTRVRSRTTQLQATLQESRESINKVTSLWTTVLESIDTIIHAIFQR